MWLIRVLPWGIQISTNPTLSRFASLNAHLWPQTSGGTFLSPSKSKVIIVYNPPFGYPIISFFLSQRYEKAWGLNYMHECACYWDSLIAIWSSYMASNVRYIPIHVCSVWRSSILTCYNPKIREGKSPNYRDRQKSQPQWWTSYNDHVIEIIPLFDPIKANLLRKYFIASTIHSVAGQLEIQCHAFCGTNDHEWDLWRDNMADIAYTCGHFDEYSMLLFISSIGT